MRDTWELGEASVVRAQLRHNGLHLGAGYSRWPRLEQLR
jgi:hypothetical protein